MLFKQKTIAYKLEAALANKSPPINMDELEKVLNKIKSGKARDPEGLAREIFKPTAIGDDLKKSLLTLFNLIKEEGKIPIFMSKATIFTIPKKNKSRLLPTNERGIFLVNSIRGIFMKILFNRKSNMIDSNMSDSNVGGRPDKSCINHIWVINGIMHEHLSSVKMEPIVIQQYDFTQMFDGMELREALSDLYNTGVEDDTLQLLYEANKSVAVRVKTSFGLTEEVQLDEVVLQGEVWGPILASNQVDTFGKEMLDEDALFMYKYKGYVPVPILGQIDDTIGITVAGFKSSQMNSYINIKTADKYLQFGQDKCKYMVVGKKIENIHIPNLEVDIWETSHDQKGDLKETFGGKKPMGNEKVLTYLGVELSSDRKNIKKTILKKKKYKQIGKKKKKY